MRAKGGSLKTRIMVGANLNSAQLDEYLNLLMETELIEMVTRKEKILYKTTRRGLSFIQDYYEITALLERGNIKKSGLPLIPLCITHK